MKTCNVWRISVNKAAHLRDLRKHPLCILHIAVSKTSIERFSTKTWRSHPYHVRRMHHSHLMSWYFHRNAQSNCTLPHECMDTQHTRIHIHTHSHIIYSSPRHVYLYMPLEYMYSLKQEVSCVCACMHACVRVCMSLQTNRYLSLPCVCVPAPQTLRFPEEQKQFHTIMYEHRNSCIPV